jgi:translation initiation factor IF-2
LAKGIRVNQLAKEIGIESKAILARCREEGLADKVPNHQSTISLGLAETIREWFVGQGGDGGTAVATAPAETATKAKASRAPSRKKVDSDDAGDAPAVDESSAPEVKVEAPVTTPTPAEPTDAPATPVVEAPTVAPVAAPAAPVAPVVADEPVVQPPDVVPPASPNPAAPTAPEQPNIAASAPAPAPVAPVRPAVTGTPHSNVPAELRPQVSRPTVTIDSIRAQQGPPIRKPVAVAPQLKALAPAQIQGPRVVREEKPDIVSAPRPRRPIGDNQGPAGPAGYSTARPTTGRGVKVSDEEEAEAAKKAKSKAAGNSIRRGADGRRGQAEEKLKEFTEADLIARRDALNAATATRTNIDRHLKQVSSRGTHSIAKSKAERGEPIEMEEPISVKSLAAAMGVKSNELITKLMRQGVFANVNQTLDTTVAESLALDYGIELRIAQARTLEDDLLAEFQARVPEEANLRKRPPVVTILGHVDHGKTSLLDKIRSANVAAGEAGGITQHTAAWMVTLGEGDAKRQVTFIDTPGHQAFTSMRARGANMTDVVVLVVSAAEGVQPQTIESINHAKAAGVPIVVALNKIDRVDANPDMVLGQLAGHDLNPVEWGGTTEVIRTSATTGQGITELIEILDYQSELLDLKADPTAPARGIVIEARVDEGLGPIATVLVQDGTLNVGDVVLSGPGYGRVRGLRDDRRKPVGEATPSMPVIVMGLSTLPSAGSKFYIVEEIERARAIAEERASQVRAEALGNQTKVTAGNLLASIAAGDVSTINLIIKADTQGSIETLVANVGGQNTEEVQVKVIHSGVGAINESDVELAMATKINIVDPSKPRKVAIIGFHVTPEDTARALAEQNHIDVKTYRVIYEIFDDLKKALSGMLSKEVREKIHGHVEVRAVFKASKLGNIAGSFVTDGHVLRTDKVRLIRDGKIVTEGLTLESLRRVKDDVREVKAGFECGIKIAGYEDVRVGDRLEAYITEEFERTL